MKRIRAGSRTITCEAVCFDKDGLLMDSDPFWQALYRHRSRHLTELAGENARKRWDRLMGIRHRQGRVLISYAGALAVSSRAEEQVITAAELQATLGCQWHEACELTRALFDRADAELGADAFVPLPGAAECLHQMLAAGVPVAIVTSDTVQRTERLLSALGLAGRIGVIVTPDMVRQGKPAPDMLRLAAERLGAPADRCVMVGDSPVDLLMATAAGAVGVGVHRSPLRRRVLQKYSDMVLRDLTRLGPR